MIQWSNHHSLTGLDNYSTAICLNSEVMQSYLTNWEFQFSSQETQESAADHLFQMDLN